MFIYLSDVSLCFQIKEQLHFEIMDTEASALQFWTLPLPAPLTTFVCKYGHRNPAQKAFVYGSPLPIFIQPLEQGLQIPFFSN